MGTIQFNKKDKDNHKFNLRGKQFIINVVGLNEFDINIFKENTEVLILREMGINEKRLNYILDNY